MSRSTVNRVLLGVAGLVLLAAGVLVLAGGLDLYRRLGVDPPSWWPLTSPDQPVVSAYSRTEWVNQSWWADRSWWWAVVIAGPAIVVAGAAWWLFAQLRRSGPATVAVPTPGASGLRLRLRSRALEEVLETGTVALPEVERAGVRLVRGRRHPRLRATVRLTPGVIRRPWSSTSRPARAATPGPASASQGCRPTCGSGWRRRSRPPRRGAAAGASTRGSGRPADQRPRRAPPSTGSITPVR